MGAILASYGLSIIMILVYIAYCARENRRRNKLDSTAGQKTHADFDFKDLTDKQEHPL
jgi:ACS family allantoate permease-like MFS transporter